MREYIIELNDTLIVNADNEEEAYEKVLNILSEKIAYSDVGVDIRESEDNMENSLRPLSSYKGTVYDMAYANRMVAYNSVEEFVNDIADTEISLAIGDFPNSYQEDELYKKYKKLKDSQEISQSELDELLEMYTYDIQ